MPASSPSKLSLRCVSHVAGKVDFHPDYKFVPLSKSAAERDVERLTEFLQKHNRILVLTGAGISTESGIPDYRSQGVGLYARSTNRPVIYQDFVKSAHIRQRYWARNFVGWPKFSSVLPNDSHFMIKYLEDMGKITWIVTQNVDTLHHKAGSRNIIELHGSTNRVMCLHCDHKMKRTELQDQIINENPEWTAHAMDIAPDGDVQLSQEQIDGFKVPHCPKCGGDLKPEIIFFGDSVPKATVNFVFEEVNHCDAVFVVGSSLEVYSGYRFVNKAHALGKPIAILCIGQTRADKLADIKIDARCSEVLTQIELN
ncbi:hypothetical protein FSP39_001007 [Pinctada imbricata]|uniref:NAD-dependent protein deacylase n=1 Tax=Pinctada imbricata TaxID=66713 RepID=A0AA88XIV2_PINIB|nr:hypothetical protein FSP39_001007 [Pinctada imbricata]